MAKKKKRGSGNKKTAARRKKSAVRRKPAPRPKARRPKTRRPKTAARKKLVKRPARRPAARLKRGTAESDLATMSSARGLGAEAGGQSGDTEGLSRSENADSESVEELLEEGQAFEAGIVSGVENAPDADKGGVRTRQVPEDDVPQEYLDED
jgi:hypothetical protein